MTDDQSRTGVVDTIVAHWGDGALHLLDHQNQVVPW